MAKVLVCGKDFATVSDVAHWANQLVGRLVPESNTMVVKDVVQFQVISEGDTLSAMVLVETERKKSMSSMVINMRKDLNLTEEG